jgi:hypothetical protein
MDVTLLLDPTRGSSPEGCTYHVSHRFPVVLVNQAAKPIAATHGAVGGELGRRRLRDCQLEAAVRPVPVVVRRELPEDSFQVAPAQDQEVVQALPGGPSSPIFRRKRSPWRL